ncbi:MAG: hypothetical protein FVQ82_11245 [Planctomycetes bacterium]|nr:hypothetical protein [Planctomycetota bacterium]
MHFVQRYLCYVCVRERIFELKAGEKKRIKITFGLGEGEYEFLCGYGGAVHGGKVLASKLVGFDVDAKGLAKNVRLINPELLVKMRFHGAAPLGRIVKLYDESALPRFYEILKDESRSGRELDMGVIYIGLISKRGNKESVKELLDYYKRSVDWDKCRDDEHDLDSHVFSKFDALGWLGFIGGEDVEEVLKDAMTVDGAKELAKEWLVDIPQTTFSVLDNLRGHAACGLAFSDNKEMLKLIKDEYAKERKVCLDAGITSDGYINQLTEAMTRIDIVKDIGLEGHRKLHDGKGSYSNLYQQYIRKYLLFKAGPPVKKQF